MRQLIIEKATDKLINELLRRFGFCSKMTRRRLITIESRIHLHRRCGEVQRSAAQCGGTRRGAARVPRVLCAFAYSEVNNFSTLLGYRTAMRKFTRAIDRY